MMNGKQLKNSILQLAIQGKLVPPACRLAGKTLTTNLLPTEETGIWYVYVIECEDGSFYKGFTTNLQKRYKEHCSGHGAEWTKKHKPKQLYYYEIQYSEEAALKREKYLKSGSGREWFKREVVDKPLEWEPASALLQRIRKEKEQLVKEGKLKKKDLVTTPISDEEKPFEIPESWEWVRMPEIAQCSLGKALDAVRNTGENRNYVAGINVYWDRFDFSTKKQMKMNDEEFEKYKLEKNDLIICEGGDYGRCAVWQDEEAIAYQKALHRARFYQNIEPRFYLYYFMLQKETNGFDDFVTGTTIKHLTNVALNSFPFPLPPLAEQKRIVAKIEELMPLVEEYDKAQTKLDDLNKKLPEALKKSILQEAIMGKLVPSSLPAGRQDPNDEPASVLLQRIHKEKEQLVKEGKLKKKDLVTTPITDEEKPFEIPESWEWCRLKDIVCNNGLKTPDKVFSYIDIGSINNKKQKLNEQENLLEAKNAPSRARKIVKFGDIVYSTVRPYLHNVAIIDRQFSAEPIASTGFAVLSTILIYNKYLFYFLLSPQFDEYANNGDNAKGIAYPAINDDKLYKACIPLPPLSEQHRIVAKIEELFGVLG